jgi:hypothetical protein
MMTLDAVCTQLDARCVERLCGSESIWSPPALDHHDQSPLLVHDAQNTSALTISEAFTSSRDDDAQYSDQRPVQHLQLEHRLR